MSLWEMSLSGGMLIFAVIVARGLFRNRLPARTFTVLWTVALIRLMVPFSVAVPCNIYTLLEQDVAGDSRESSERSFAESGVGEQGRSFVQNSEEAQSSFPLWEVLYFAGGLLCAAFYLTAYLKCNREFRTALPVEDGAVQEWICSFSLKRQVQVRQSGLIATPMTYGVFHPVILLPREIKWENPRQMQFVLTHELVHIRRFDAFRKLLFAAAVCVHWWNPLVWVMNILANRDMELACDESVLQYFGQDSRKAYALSLLSLAERKNNLMTWGSGFSKNAMEERIVAIMKKKKLTGKAVAGAAVLVVFVTVLFATSSAQENTGEATYAAAQESARQDTEHDTGAAAEQAEEDDRLTIRIPVPDVPFVDDNLGLGEFRDYEQVLESDDPQEKTGIINLFQDDITFGAQEETYSGPEVDMSGDACETDGDTVINFPKEYKKYGVTEDGTYKEKHIAVLYDAGYFIYCSGCDGILETETAYLLVKRDSQGKITSFQEITKKEMQKSVEKEGLEM